MAGNFEGRHVVVTGGTGALGSAVVGQLLAADATCHIPCHSAEELKRFPYTQRCKIAEGVDLTDEKSVESFYTRFGSASGLALWASIHIAGGFAMGPVERASRADFARMMDMNALTCFLSCREAVRHMKARQSAGRIVNVAARPGLVPELGSGMVAYTASKAAVAAISQSLGAEVAGEGILVNAVAPSIMDTPANRASMPKADFAKWPKVEEVAATIVYLASPENAVARSGLVPVYGRA
jgi:NAD(P)-dependent dehydrogenase (short-subunit alcohol dehydrogenase family)